MKENNHMADEEKSDNEQKKDEKPKGGGKKLLIIGLLSGLILGGGGAAGFFIMQPSEADEDAIEEIVEEVEPAPVLPDYRYVDIERLQLPNIYNGRVLNYVSMNVSMEVIGEQDKMLLEKTVLIIRDSLIRYYSENSIGRKDSPRIADFEGLSEKIKEFANNEVHKEIVERVIVNESRAL